MVAVNPPTGSTGVDPGSPVEIVFSEAVDSRTVEASLFVSPAQLRDPRIRVRGGRVTVKLRDGLARDATTVLTIGAGVTDLRGNKLAQSYTVALTTGDSIDTGAIRGLVFSAEPTQGMLVGGWLVTDTLQLMPDSLPPQYLTQVGAGGAFALEYLPVGVYRVLCWSDRNGDRRWDPGVDRLGLPSGDVSLSDSTAGWMAMAPALRDTSQLRLILLSAGDDRHVTLRFNRRLKDDWREIAYNLTLADSSGGVAIESAWLNTDDSSRITLLTRTLSPEVTYRLSIPGDTAAYEIKGAAEPDTMPPRITAIQPPEGDRNVLNLPAGLISFDDAIAVDSLLDRLRLFRNDSLEVVISAELSDAHVIRWQALDSLASGAKCRLEVRLTGIADLAGNRIPFAVKLDSTALDTTESPAWRVDTLAVDSLRKLTFSIVDPTETGSISGAVEGGTPPVMAVARGAGGRAGKDYMSLADPDGGFLIDRLPAGKYILWAFEDSDHDGVHRVGEISPFAFAERITIGQDTVEVRSRWETGGLKLEFR